MHVSRKKQIVLLSSSLNAVLKELKEEVNIAYKRSVNSMEFKNVVTADPEAFAYVTLPPDLEPPVPPSGNWMYSVTCITVYLTMAIIGDDVYYCCVAS